jgi:hypothetical protein
MSPSLPSAAAEGKGLHWDQPPKSIINEYIIAERDAVMPMRRDSCIRCFFGQVIALLLLSSFAVAQGNHTGKSIDRLDAKVTQEIERLNDRIKAELKTLPNHDWAGEYYMGDGLGACITLLLSPKSGVTYQWDSDLGLRDQNKGAVSANGQRMEFKWAYSDTEEDELESDFLLVRWGERRYFVEVNRILSFCLDIEQKREPRKDIHGLWYMRVGDENKKVEGNPELPKGFEKYLHMKPIEGTITALGRSKLDYFHEPSNQDRVRQEVKLGIGEKDGVLARMKFEAVNERFAPFTWARVTTVRQKDCDAVIFLVRKHSDTSIPDLVGRKVKTPE